MGSAAKYVVTHATYDTISQTLDRYRKPEGDGQSYAMERFVPLKKQRKPLTWWKTTYDIIKLCFTMLVFFIPPWCPPTE